ncbi:MAG: hypothetical protein A2Z99_17775 [Treponema sp. GWB1_62_6]|nr:MAG: hypothetical protein A2Z99_17775 [Treponema sp. GWB1_62_6]
MIPGMKTMGKKARQVVSVEEKIGTAISFMPSTEARNRVFPIEAWRNMFSTATMPLSTNIPRAMIRLNSTIILRVIPMACSTKKDISMEKGMASETNRALRKPRKKMVISSTSTKPENMLFSRSEMVSLMNLDSS